MRSFAIRCLDPLSFGITPESYWSTELVRWIDANSFSTLPCAEKMGETYMVDDSIHDILRAAGHCHHNCPMPLQHGLFSGCGVGLRRASHAQQRTVVCGQERRMRLIWRLISRAGIRLQESRCRAQALAVDAQSRIGEQRSLHQPVASRLDGTRNIDGRSPPGVAACGVMFPTGGHKPCRAAAWSACRLVGH
jgi:hypothetical protein